VPKQTEAVAATVEERLAHLIVEHDVFIGDYRISDSDRSIIIKALRDRARWMAADTTSGEKRK
jgi:hypothetical protein